MLKFDPNNFTSETVYAWVEEFYSKIKLFDYKNNEFPVSKLIQCLRRTYFEWIGIPKAHTGNIVMMIGYGYHLLFQRILQEKGFEIEKRVEMERNGVKIVGSIDAYHPETKTVIEIKLIDNLPKEPIREHVLQAKIYGSMVDALHIFLLYVSRRNGKVRVFPVPRDDRVIDWIFQRAEKLKKFLEEENPPPKEKSILCKYCEYRWECLKAG